MENGQTERQREYARYLASKEWQRTRALALEYYGHSCCLCGRSKEDGVTLQVHHRYYSDRNGDSIVGRESLRDLTVLCYSCHKNAAHLNQHKRRVPLQEKEPAE
jgi:hypothetical protein